MNHARNIAAALLLTALTPLARADDQADSKAAAVAVVKAIAAGDHDAVGAHIAGAGVEKQLADAMIDLIGGAKALHEASVAQFGEAAASSNVIDPKRMVDQVEQSTVQVTGDTAQMIGPGADPTTHDGMHLKRVGGEWKVDKMSGTKPAAIMLKILTPMAAAMKETAEEVKAGKYKDQAAVQMAMKNKVQAAMKASGIVPATRPAAPAPAAP